MTTHTNVAFELLSIEAVVQNNNPAILNLQNGEALVNGKDKHSTDDDSGCHIHLKGQMLFMDEWQSMVYLATPM